MTTNRTIHPLNKTTGKTFCGRSADHADNGNRSPKFRFIDCKACHKAEMSYWDKAAARIKTALASV